MTKKQTYSPTIDKLFLLADISMVVLVIINLTLLGIQLNFESQVMRNLFQEYIPAFYNLYLPVYEHFGLIDACFVGFFLVEFTFRWVVAISLGTYHRWFFYPFAHWYDLLGCIPIGSMRALRFLRVVAILIRIHRMGIVNLRQFYLFKLFTKYMKVLTEEVSDRVVVNIIESVQEEVKAGIPLTGKIIEQVVLPRKDVLVDYIAHRVQKVTRDQYALNREDLRESIRISVSEAIQQNQNIRVLEQLPMVGKAASAALQQSVYDITFQTINSIFERMSSEESRVVIEKITDGVIETLLTDEEDEKLKKTFTDMVIQSLDLVKEEVQIQQWKLHEKRK